MKFDPQERDPKKKKLIKAAETEAEYSMEQDGTIQLEGSCHILWGRQQKILKEKYGIKWRSPAEMNPDVLFD
ncbi:MAG: hypothetical protein H8D23_34585 [Candidatus Brocadiales bacterium]|nr:hypothetical protein [Candidatus Brocadiales bacterium]